MKCRRRKETKVNVMAIVMRIRDGDISMKED